MLCHYYLLIVLLPYVILELSLIFINIVCIPPFCHRFLVGSCTDPGRTKEATPLQTTITTDIPLHVPVRAPMQELEGQAIDTETTL
jgi:hypothetical protein